MFVNYFRTAQIQYMLFWLLKDALLQGKRTAFTPQKSTFYHAKGHLLLYIPRDWGIRGHLMDHDNQIHIE